MHPHFTNLRFPVATALLALVWSHAASAGSETIAPKLSKFDGQSTDTIVSSTAATEYVILHRPYLKITGPTGIRLAANSEPLLRRPPAMPAVRKAPKEDAADAKTAPETKPEKTVISTLLEPVLPTGPSVFNGDQQSTTLPPAPTPAPTPAEPAPSAPLPDALSNGQASPNELSSALPYFEVPNANGTTTTLPLPPLSLEPPVGAPLPPSSATYEVQ